MRRLILLGILTLTAAAAPEQSIAIPPRVLPAFDVTAADGSVSLASQITRNGKWLLIFVKPNCPPCDSLLSALDSESTQNGSRVAIIVKSPTAKTLAQLKIKYPRISNSAWYADVHAKAASSLEIPASPTTLGMKGSAIAWRLTGSISALPTAESSGLTISPGITPDATRDPKIREHALLNGWLTQP